MDNRKKILEMISKLTKLTSKDSGAFQGEIDNAAAKIQELMDKYSISQAEVDEAKNEQAAKTMEEEFKTQTAEYVIKGIKKWHMDFAQAVAEMTHTKRIPSVYSSGNSQRAVMNFFGVKENTEVASAIFVEWVQIIQIMCESAVDDHWKYLMKEYDYAGHLKEKKESGYGDEKFQDRIPYEERTTYFKPSWLQGCVDSIISSVRQQNAKRAKEMTNAIVLYKEKVEEKFIEAYEGKTEKFNLRSGKVASNIGYSRGREAGSKINLGSKRIKGE
jgi:hypothetical protein